MSQYKIIREVRKELARYDKPEYKINIQKFYKEKLANSYAIKTPIVRKIASGAFKQIKNQPKNEILDLCERLLKSGDGTERGIAFIWAGHCQKTYAKSDFKRFESWLKNYVVGWGSCDHLCSAVIGPLLFQFPELVPKIKKWTRSKNRWLRRASAVSLIYSLNREKQLDTSFEIADILLIDEDDMVQKGYGWMLKEAGNIYREQVFQYVIKHKEVMPRTALRYAIEKFPPEMRKEAMQKD